MKYNCENCNYSTNEKSNWTRHNLTKIHKKNQLKLASLNQVVSFGLASEANKKPGKVYEDDNKFICKYCETCFSHSSSLTRHKKNCSEKNNLKVKKQLQVLQKEKDIGKLLQKKNIEIKIIELESKDKEISLLKQSKDKEIFLLKQMLEDKEKQISELKYVLKASGILKKPTYSSLTFIVNNYKSAPVLSKLDNYDYIKCNKEDIDFMETIINYFENNNLSKYLGDILIKAYKKDDSSQQSFWNTDTNRLTYVIKESIEYTKFIESTKFIDNNDKSKWSIDKSGIKISLNIINPLLNYLVPITITYIEDLGLRVQNDIKNVTKYMNKMELASNIKKQIDEKVLANEILKYISPHFYFDKKDELIIE